MGIADDVMAARAGSMIQRWGGAAQLLRDGELRSCVAATLDYNPRASQLNMQDLERALIAAPLTVAPHHQRDFLIKNGRKYRIVAPVKGPRPGERTIYYDLDIVYTGPYPET